MSTVVRRPIDAERGYIALTHDEPDLTYGQLA